MLTLNAEHINPFLMAAKKVMQDMCFVEVGIQKPVLKKAAFESDSWVIIIGVTGEMRGQVLIAMSGKSACSVASKMCMMEVSQIDDFAASALSELGNMIMGNAATVFSSNGVGIDITPPTLSNGKVSFSSAYAKTLCVPMTMNGENCIELFLALRQEDC
ncbi:MAG TPA: chemotaxis protein CheX [Lachnospiraceae bacterium]|nr:chemotaxis protein CheX [Lachnospiraceae bacterium]